MRALLEIVQDRLPRLTLAGTYGLTAQIRFPVSAMLKSANGKGGKARDQGKGSKGKGPISKRQMKRQKGPPSKLILTFSENKAIGYRRLVLRPS